MFGSGFTTSVVHNKKTQSGRQPIYSRFAKRNFQAAPFTRYAWRTLKWPKVIHLQMLGICLVYKAKQDLTGSLSLRSEAEQISSGIPNNCVWFYPFIHNSPQHITSFFFLSDYRPHFESVKNNFIYYSFLAASKQELLQTIELANWNIWSLNYMLQKYTLYDEFDSSVIYAAMHLLPL